jgi:prolyl 4-hydroxylase
VTAERFELLMLPGFLEAAECVALCSIIDRHARHVEERNLEIVQRVAVPTVLTRINVVAATSIQARLARAIGIKPEYCEPLQGQRYVEGQYWEEHWDAFHEGSPRFIEHVPRAGQRTWTGMIYLNSVERGGETVFPAVGVSICPQPGMALLWYNLDREGKRHPLARHYGAQVIKGSKYVVTTWFRERPYLE